MGKKEFSMVQELTNKYEIKEISDDEMEICIKIPKEFENLWLIKLSELKISLEEIKKIK